MCLDSYYCFEELVMPVYECYNFYIRFNCIALHDSEYNCYLYYSGFGCDDKDSQLLLF